MQRINAMKQYKDKVSLLAMNFEVCSSLLCLYLERKEILNLFYFGTFWGA
jgi:hypothetical protein